MGIKNIFIDMDCTIADFYRSPMFKGKRCQFNPAEMYEIGFFEDLSPMPGALMGVRKILQFAKEHNIEVHILSKPVACTWYSYSEKVKWIMKWFPELTNSIILCQKKGLIAKPGNVLIDDSIDWKGPWESEGGSFIHFIDSNSSPEYWTVDIINQLNELNK